MEVHQFMLFLTASAVLAATPGPGMLYVLSRTFAGGRKEGVTSSLGTFFGGMVHVVAAAAGLSVVLATSAVAFSAVKFAGAAYLIYLGTRMVLSAKKDAEMGDVTIARKGSPLLQGFVTEALNPKTALFFLSFIPQFVPRHNPHVFYYFVLLGLISVTLNTTGDLVAILLADPLKKIFTRSPRARINQRRTSGAVMIALGACVAVSDSH